MDQTFSTFSFCRAVVLAGFIALACGGATAQWQWTDGAGRKVFSDTPPPAGTPEKSILKRPGPTRTVAPVAAASVPAVSATTATAPKPSGRDEQLEAKKKQAEEAEQAKMKAEADKLGKARAENCERAKRAKVTLDSGIRIATTNARGEREFLDDKARAAEAKRIDETIRSDCGPATQADQ